MEKKVIWYFGKTDTGKSHRAFNHDDTEDVYNFSKGWLGYRGEKIVIFDNIYGFSYHELMELARSLGKERRLVNSGKNRVPLLCHTIIVTHLQPPEKRFPKANMRDLYRLFEVIECKDHDNSERHYLE